MVCMVLVSGLTSGQAYMVKPLLDKIFFEQNRYYLNLLPLALIALFLVKGIFYFGFSYLIDKVGQSIVLDLRKQTYNHIQSLSTSFFHKTPTGELISRIIADINFIQAAVSHAVISLLKDFFQLIGLIGVIFYMDWKLAFLSLIFLPVSLFPIVHFGRQHRKLSTLGQQQMAEVSSMLHETIAGNRIVKAFCMEKYEGKRFANMSQALFDFLMRDVKVRSFSHALIEFLGGLFIAFIVFYGGLQVMAGQSTPGTFFSFLTALILIYEPIKGLSRVNSTFQYGIAAAIRVFSVLDIEPEVKDSEEAVVLPPMQKSIELRNVRFQYSPKAQVLHGIDLSIKSGEVIAIVGPSGGGKTTLVNLIPRFFEVTEGSIVIDGLDTREVTLHSLRNQLAMVTQQTILFNDTVRNNIAYGDPDKSEEELRAAAKAAYALDFIEKLPDGFDTVIGESGAKLSGGQQQRLSIARALLKNAPILILDEATSSLDTESEREVQQALENLMKNRTTIVIAHRLSTIKNADRIIVIQDGKIVEQGSHEVLLEKKGLYEMLHHMQL
jgi:subfamily B ATP-binding cassette protein MsbA